MIPGREVRARPGSSIRVDRRLGWWRGGPVLETVEYGGVDYNDSFLSGGRERP